MKRNKHDSVTIESLDQGYIVSYSGRNDQDNWENFKRYCVDLTEVQRVVCEFYDFEVEL